MKGKRTQRAAALTVILLLTLSGCTYIPLGGSSQGSAPESAEESVGETTAAPTTTTTTTAAPTTTTTAKPYAVNPLTGVRDIEIGASTRTVGIMIGNNDRSRPQYGIDQADWLIEAETEGGITRIMAVFADVSRVPDPIGPVRSARTPFVMLAQSLDLIYAHAGGSDTADAMLGEIGIAEINALHYDGTTFWRDATLRAQKGLEYSMMTSGAKLKERIAKKNFRTEGRSSTPFCFDGNAAQGEAVTTLQCKVSAGQTVNFQYDPDKGLYYKYNGTRQKSSSHKTAAGVPLSASNVIVLFDKKYAENSVTIGFELKHGSGLLFTAGKVRPITWSRTVSSLAFTETDGSAAAVSVGKSYLLLVSDSYRDKTVYTAA